MKDSRAYWVCQIAGWGSQAIANLALAAAFSPRLAFGVVGVYLSSAVSGIAITHVYRKLLHRYHWLDMAPLRSGFIACVASVVMALVQTLCVTVAYAVARVPGSFHGWQWIPAAVAIWVVTLLLWHAIYAAVHYLRRTRRAELQNLQLDIAAKSAELRALQAQINPHFLFNSLNSLRALIHEDPPRAEKMVTELASVLRYALQSGKVRTISLQSELEAVSAYLAVESIRFEERLRVRMETEGAVHKASVPPMLVQLLVENAIKHGVERQSNPGEVLIRVKCNGASVQVEVRNPGKIEASRPGNRVGLENARKRLQLLFGNDARLKLSESKGSVTALAYWREKEGANAGTDC